ncbi:indolepyruvate ferredoxin oxidoreductase subunit alpha [Nocardia sp. NPDC051321]|uniref:indolepyruvate ferredoxin oxidoreductase subunit alpha n=1 Tax=Nocardia sp. NPDC051321 TaxID=3364323 RepID=UPI0037B44631
MPFVITELCIGHKDSSCVAACPVDAIHPGPQETDFADHDRLYIDPTECVDCSACEPACPFDAIYPDHEVPEELQSSVGVNRDYYENR